VLRLSIVIFKAVGSAAMAFSGQRRRLRSPRYDGFHSANKPE
jgi:hypothetical protein